MKIAGIVFLIFGFCFILLEKFTYYEEIEELNSELPFEEQVRPYSLMNFWGNVKYSLQFRFTPKGWMYRNRIWTIRTLSALSFGVALLLFWLSKK
jgi:hypothetical protein